MRRRRHGLPGGPGRRSGGRGLRSGGRLGPFGPGWASCRGRRGRALGLGPGKDGTGAGHASGRGGRCLGRAAGLRPDRRIADHLRAHQRREVVVVLVRDGGRLHGEAIGCLGRAGSRRHGAGKRRDEWRRGLGQAPGVVADVVIGLSHHTDRLGGTDLMGFVHDRGERRTVIVRAREADRLGRADDLLDRTGLGCDDHAGLGGSRGFGTGRNVGGLGRLDDRRRGRRDDRGFGSPDDRRLDRSGLRQYRDDLGDADHDDRGTRTARPWSRADIDGRRIGRGVGVLRLVGGRLVLGRRIVVRSEEVTQTGGGPHLGDRPLGVVDLRLASQESAHLRHAVLSSCPLASHSPALDRWTSRLLPTYQNSSGPQQFRCILAP